LAGRQIGLNLALGAFWLFGDDYSSLLFIPQRLRGLLCGGL